MARLLAKAVGGQTLDDFAALHDKDSRSHAPDDGKVVRDEQSGEGLRSMQFFDEGEHGLLRHAV